MNKLNFFIWKFSLKIYFFKIRIKFQQYFISGSENISSGSSSTIFFRIVVLLAEIFSLFWVSELMAHSWCPSIPSRSFFRLGPNVCWNLLNTKKINNDINYKINTGCSLKSSSSCLKSVSSVFFAPYGSFKVLND